MYYGGSGSYYYYDSKHEQSVASPALTENVTTASVMPNLTETAAWPTIPTVTPLPMSQQLWSSSSAATCSCDFVNFQRLNQLVVDTCNFDSMSPVYCVGLTALFAVMSWKGMIRYRRLIQPWSLMLHIIQVGLLWVWTVHDAKATWSATVSLLWNLSTALQVVALSVSVRPILQCLPLYWHALALFKRPSAKREVTRSWLFDEVAIQAIFFYLPLGWSFMAWRHFQTTFELDLLQPLRLGQGMMVGSIVAGILEAWEQQQQQQQQSSASFKAESFEEAGEYPRESLDSASEAKRRILSLLPEAD